MNKKLLIAFSLWLLSFTLPTSSLHAYILDSFVFPECWDSLAWDIKRLMLFSSTAFVFAA